MEKKEFNAENIEDWWKPVEHINEGVTIGIDFGTTNSCIAYWDTEMKSAEVIEFDDNQTIPSVVAFASESNIYVGSSAVEYEETYPLSCVSHVKRLLGKRYEDPEISDFKKAHQFELIKNSSIQSPHPNIQIRIPFGRNNKKYSPEYICTCILSYIKNSVEGYLGKKVGNCVLTVPAYFSSYQRESLLSAATESGINVLRLIGEPTAAALSYGLGVAGTKNVVICDFGGGTFDVSILHIHEGQFKILGIGGDNNLGGEDIDQLLYTYLITTYCDKHNTYSEKEKVMILREIETIKCELSTYNSVNISDEITTLFNKNKKEMKPIVYTREEFDILIEPIIKRCISIISGVMGDVHLTIQDIQEVVVVGGSSRLLSFQKQVSEYFNNKELCKAIDPKTCVAEGAAIQAAALCGVDKELLRNVLMLDALPLNIGVKTTDGKMNVILPRNILIPAKRTRYFKTFEDNQKGITVDVYEGSDSIADHNKLIGSFDIPITHWERKAGEEPIGVSIEMTINGVLKVTSDHFVEEDDGTQTKTFIILCIYILMLFGFYLFAKLYFQDARDALNPHF
ncbi:hypothetical protein WA158_008218 [Blastocystis sp. Blastoise]